MTILSQTVVELSLQNFVTNSMKMVPLAVEVGYSEEFEISIVDPTQSLLRVHTDECLCGKDAGITQEFGNNIYLFI